MPAKDQLATSIADTTDTAAIQPPRMNTSAQQAAGAAAVDRIAAKSLSDGDVANDYMENAILDTDTTVQAKFERMQKDCAHTFAAIGVPAPTLEQSADLNDGAAFIATQWTIFVPQSMTVAGGNQSLLEALLYHECRHAEQWFRMARLLAGDGQNADVIATRLHIPQAIAAEAAKLPLQRGTPEAKQAAEWLASLDDPRTLAEEKDALKQVSGRLSELNARLMDPRRSDSDHRAAFLEEKALLAKLRPYLNISFERDAYAVGGLVDEGEDMPAGLEGLDQLTWEKVKAGLAGGD